MPNSEKFVRGARLSAADTKQMQERAAVVLSGPDGETINAMSYGERVVEALDEYVDAKISYDLSRRVSGADYANPKPVSKARKALTDLLDRKFKVRL